MDVSGREKILYHFQASKEQAQPASGLIADAAGNLYGTTNGDIPTVFKLDPKGHESILHRFSGRDGCAPASELTMDSAGNLYGVASNCGATHFGTVFKIAP